VVVVVVVQVQVKAFLLVEEQVALELAQRYQ
jgi:hypothetical protein